MTDLLFAATVFGDPHIITFDNVEYTFNGKGEFVLVQANQGSNKLNVQGRFEQTPDNVYGEVRATMLTAIAGKSIDANLCLCLKFTRIEKKRAE